MFHIRFSIRNHYHLHFAVDFGLLFVIICAHVEQCSYYSLASQSVLHTAENSAKVRWEHIQGKYMRKISIENDNKRSGAIVLFSVYFKYCDGGPSIHVL